LEVNVEQVKQLREERGWSQLELARRSGVDNAVISVVEAGKRSPSLPTLKKLATALGVDLAELFGTREQREYRRYREAGHELLKQAHESLARAAEVVGPEEEFMKLPREEQDRRLDYAERFRVIAEEAMAMFKETDDEAKEKGSDTLPSSGPSNDPQSKKESGDILPGN
jgi:transcriptional regulator with XRE-family HTH domain